jgi:hypothetical protein
MLRWPQKQERSTGILRYYSFFRPDQRALYPNIFNVSTSRAPTANAPHHHPLTK